MKLKPPNKKVKLYVVLDEENKAWIEYMVTHLGYASKRQFLDDLFYKLRKEYEEKKVI